MQFWKWIKKRTGRVPKETWIGRRKKPRLWRAEPLKRHQENKEKRIVKKRKKQSVQFGDGAGQTPPHVHSGRSSRGESRRRHMAWKYFPLLWKAWLWTFSKLSKLQTEQTQKLAWRHFMMILSKAKYIERRERKLRLPILPLETVEEETYKPSKLPQNRSKTTLRWSSAGGIVTTWPVRYQLGL